MIDQHEQDNAKPSSSRARGRLVLMGLIGLASACSPAAMQTGGSQDDEPDGGGGTHDDNAGSDDDAGGGRGGADPSSAGGGAGIAKEEGMNGQEGSGDEPGHHEQGGAGGASGGEGGSGGAAPSAGGSGAGGTARTGGTGGRGAMPPDNRDPALAPDQPPSSNFDLNLWYLSVPTDEDDSGTADSIQEEQLNLGYENDKFFYTGADGGMVFRCPIGGYRTSTNTQYTRVELREMLRDGNKDIATQGVNKNNWVFSSAPSSDQEKAGGVDGTLKATLAVNHVTITGDRGQVGRVIIGQIHANDDEPVRLYYRKLPGNDKGSIYFAHEPRGDDDVNVEMIGSRSSNATNPEDGVALDEIFSYEITVKGNALHVIISREGKPPVSKSYDMSGSGYDEGGQYMYFKAGVYNQNNSGEDADYVQATFYDLEVTHN